MYSALILNDKSHNRLVQAFSKDIPEGWEVIAHHMTIKMGPLTGKFEQLKGLEAKATVTHFACNDRVCAVLVDTLVPSTNQVKHITLAVNRQAGGKPHMSNNLKDWQQVAPVVLFGLIQESE